MENIKFGLVSLLVFFIGINSLYSQIFQEESNFISVGYGYSVFTASTLFNLYEDEDNFSTSNFGPVNFQFEHALDEDIGLGVDIGFSNVGVSWEGEVTEFNPETNQNEVVDYNYDYKRTKFTLNLRANYHLAKDEMFDPYVGFGLGFRSSNWNLDSNDDDFEGVEFSNFVPLSILLRFGARAMFSENVGAFIEGGVGHGIVQGGLVVKL